MGRPSKTKPPPIDGRRFRLFLQAELVRRCKANPRYSLRAFARFLAVEPSALSKILSGKRGVTPETFKAFSARLAIEPAVAKTFVRSGRTVEGATVFDADAARIALDAFAVVADWYHMAILELCAVKGFKSEPAWIARALGISLAEAVDAVDRLIRVQLLRVGPRGALAANNDETTTIGAADTAAALRKMQHQVLELAARALDDAPVDERDQSAMTMAVSLSRLPEAKARIKAFRRELCAFLEGRSPREEVYTLSVSLFPVSRVRALRPAAAPAKKPSPRSPDQNPRSEGTL